MDEIERLKQQKAQLRCEHVQLKRKYTELETESAKFGTLKKVNKEMEQKKVKISSLKK